MESRNKCASLPRILLGATGSGCGKTTITCGILKLLQRAGKTPVSFKCGPDYIDPMFHKEVLGIESRNLDLFFNSRNTVKKLLGEHARRENADIAVMEGVMGYYDGLGGTSVEAGSYDLARSTGTPAILIVDGRGKSYSMVAEIKGFLELEEESMIRGVIINRTTGGMYPLFKKMIEESLPVQVLGYVPVLKEGVLESRHLGLVTAAEVEGLDRTLEDLASVMEETVDVDGILSLAGQAEDLVWEEDPRPEAEKYEGIKIAVARDKAFCFYYEDNLDLLRKQGAEITEFSPLTDTTLPEGTAGLLLGGGYPELYLGQLSANKAMRGAILSALQNDLPCLAECGGFMFLHEWIQDKEGRNFPGVGFLSGSCVPKDQLVRFGYITLTAGRDTLLCKAGETIRGHEFHYWESEDPGDVFHAQKPSGSRSWDCIRQVKTTLAGYPHLNFRSQPEAAERFAALCRAYKGRGV